MKRPATQQATQQASQRDARRRAYQRGHRGEMWASMLLRLKGYRILARRYKTPVGEVDIIARRGKVIAFVEVKVRPDGAQAMDAITGRQRDRIVRAASVFMVTHPGGADAEMRFDAVLVAHRFLRWPVPRHLPDAWRP